MTDGPHEPAPDSRQERCRQLKRLRQQLDEARTQWRRWMPRLKRTFTAIVKIDRRIRSLERRIARLNPS